MDQHFRVDSMKFQATTIDQQIEQKGVTSSR